MPDDSRLYERQAQADAVAGQRVARALKALEGAEGGRGLLAREAWSLIGDGDADEGAAGGRLL